jgi:hypothetical protein
MKSRIAIEVLACALALGCGGSVFTFGDPGDAGTDASSGGAGGGTTGSSSSTSATVGTGTTSGTSSGAGTVGTGAATTTGSGTTSSTASTGGSTTTAGVTAGSGGTTGGSATTGGIGGSGGAGGGGKAGAGGKAGGSGAGGGVDGGVDWGQCSGAGQCTAELTGCCAPCGMQELQHFAGVNSKYIDAFKTFTCPVPMPCPRCATAPNPYIGARCVNSRCQAFDTRQVPEFSKCALASDCRLRKGLECCECGSLDDWTAVSIAGQAALTATVCAPMSACPDCAPQPPANMKAVCNGGHCEVAFDPAGPD